MSGIVDPGLAAVIRNADEHRNGTPDLRGLLEEVAELAAALDGVHEHDAAYELAQIGGIAVNWLRSLEAER